MNPKKFRFFFALISLMVLNGASQSEASAQEAKPPCRLQISLAHISTDIYEKYGFPAVKVDAWSICNVPQSKVTITVEIWKIGEVGNHKVRWTTIYSPGITSAGKQVNNYSTWEKCKNSRLTKYYGVSYSKAFIAGKWQYAKHVLSAEPIPLRCGT